MTHHPGGPGVGPDGADGLPQHGAAPDGAPEGAAPDGGGHGGGHGGAWAMARELGVVLVVALVLSVLIKTLLIQAFYIPSESMEDTLVKDDKVVVSKLTPGPFDLKRGDVVVFKDPGRWLTPAPKPERGPLSTAAVQALTFVGILPSDSGEHLIKRVIGLPGDTVVCCDEQDRLTVNGAPVDETSYLKRGVAPSGTSFSVTVPAGRIWVMGDNRPQSGDSRFHQDNGFHGTVPIENVVGRAFVLVWPVDRFRWLTNPGDAFAGVPAPH